MAEVGKVKAELNQSISKLEGECSGLKDKLAQANKALSGEGVRTNTHIHSLSLSCMSLSPHTHTHSLSLSLSLSHTHTHKHARTH